MFALIASFFSLFVGPLVYQTFGPLRRTDKIVSSVVLVVVVGTILFEILPVTYKTIGITALALCFLGFVGPTLIEKSFQKAADTTHKLTILLGILGLLVHAFIDGIAIQTSTTQTNISHHSHNLILAIILHRLPVGLTIWWLLKPLLGERYALITLFLMGITTLLGYVSSEFFENYQNNLIFSLLQSFVAGSLMHVVIHKPHPDGCTHASEKHQLHLHSKYKKAQKKVNDKDSSMLKKYLYRWENFGFLLGFTILFLTHIFH